MEEIERDNPSKPVDRTRQFSLPGVHELNKDQDEALALPLQGQYLIIGGPGTGKSVVALLRARRLADDERTYRTLVYNHLLDHSNRHLFGNDRTYVAKTWESWFGDIYQYFFHSAVPRRAPESAGAYAAIDWEAVEQQVLTLEKLDDYSDKFLVIDEGQDMPPAFYRTLTHLGFVNFYVAADQSQQIHPERCSSRQDIENSLGITAGVLELKTNYRNTRPIALLAQHFYPGDPASPRPDLPQLRSSAMTPELLTYGGENGTTLATIAENILQLSDRNPRKLIGIITPNNKVRLKFNTALLSAHPKLDHDKPPIQTFVSGQRQLPDFGQGGLVIINAQSCKGLEFDRVILVDIDQHQPKYDPHVLKARFYVMVTRAREQVMFLRTGAHCPVVEGLLPTDPAILVRK